MKDFGELTKKYFTMFCYIIDQLTKEGDWYLSREEGGIVVAGDMSFLNHFDEETKNRILKNRFPKVDLFLCTREVEVGDTFYTAPSETEHKCIEVAPDGLLAEDGNKYAKELSFKKVGKMRGKREFLNSGQEYDDEDLYYLLPGESIKKPMSDFHKEGKERKHHDTVAIFKANGNPQNS